jgi:uncharacterized protein
MAKAVGSNPTESTIASAIGADKHHLIKVGYMTVTTTLKDQLRKLVELQAMDVELYHFKSELRDRPLEIERLQAEFEAKKLKLKQLDDKLKTIQVAQKSFDNDLKSKEDAIAKADMGLSLLKTNKEYQARLLEIENLKADKSLIEEKVLLGFDEVDAARKELEAERAIVAQYEKDFLAKKKEVEETVALMADQVKVKESQRSRITPDVRPDILSRYDRIVQNKEGLAIVPVVEHACAGCNMHVTDQLMNQIKMNEQMICCDMCARILYLADEL